MSDGYLGFQNPSAEDKATDTEIVTFGGAPTSRHRERIQLAGVLAAELAAVLNAVPGASIYGLVTWMNPRRKDITTTGFDATTAATDALVANAARIGLIVQNISDAWVFIRFGSNPVATVGSEVGIAIAPNGGKQEFLDNVDTRVVKAIHQGASGNKRILIHEW